MVNKLINLYFRKKRRKKIDKKGLHFSDPILSYFKGYNKINAAISNAILLYKEVNSIEREIVPSFNDKVFFVDCPDVSLAAILNKYLLGHYYISNKHIYNNSYSFGNFISNIAFNLVTKGKSFYAIDWEEENISDKILILPKLRYLSTSTLNVEGDKTKRRFKQRYSFIFWLFNTDIDGARWPKKYSFDSSEIFYTYYPFSKITPTKKSLKHLNKVIRLWDESIYRAEAAARPEKIAFKLERARYQSGDDEIRKLKLLRAKIKSNYNLPISDLKVSSYYDVYQIVKYYKYLNNFRKFIIDEFNNQVMANLAKLNKIENSPIVKERELMTNKEIDEWFEKYVNKQITLEKFITEVINKHIVNIKE